jgi:hypothetical protein
MQTSIVIAIIRDKGNDSAAQYLRLREYFQAARHCQWRIPGPISPQRPFEKGFRKLVLSSTPPNPSST